MHEKKYRDWDSLEDHQGNSYWVVGSLHFQRGVHVQLQSSDFSVEGAESLGFNLIISLVMQLYGSISVENKNGAVFTITLPRLM